MDGIEQVTMMTRGSAGPLIYLGFTDINLRIPKLLNAAGNYLNQVRANIAELNRMEIPIDFQFDQVNRLFQQSIDLSNGM